MAKRRGSGDGSIQRRGKNRWRVSVELGPDPITGKRRRYRFSVKGTRKDALRALRKALSERDHSGVDPDEITTEEWLVRWLEERVRDEAIGPNSEYNYVRILWKHLIPAIGNVRLQDLRAAQIRELKTRLSQSLKPGTVKKILGLLRQSLQAAVTLQLLASNPASAVPSPSLKRDRKEHRALNKEESERLVEVAKGTPYAMVIRFALGTGVRQGELLGATWDAIDLERREFRVVQTLQIVKGEFQLLPPKTDRGRRTITLSRKLVKRLRKHRRKQNAARLELGQAWEDRDLVFPNGRGGVLAPRRLLPALPGTGRHERDRKAQGGQVPHAEAHRREPLAQGWRGPAGGFPAPGTRDRVVHDGHLRAHVARAAGRGGRGARRRDLVIRRTRRASSRATPSKGESSE